MAGVGLLKKVDGEFVAIGGKENGFRGAWAPDSLAKQYTFEAGIPSEFTSSGVHNAPVSIVSVAATGIAGAPGPFTSAVHLGLTQMTPAHVDLHLDLSGLKIKNISRVSAWFGQRINDIASSNYRQEILVNGVIKSSTPWDDHAWLDISAGATNDDVVSFRNVCNYGGTIGWYRSAAVAGIRIYNRAEPYMLDDFVTHNGEMWKSLIDNNADTPGVGLSWEKAITLPRPSGTTAQRPTPVSAGTGFMYYDTDLKVPVWSDGTMWRDAAGFQSPPP